MAKFIPFPPALAELSAQSVASQARSARRADNRQYRQVAAYRMPDGALRPAHDFYRPEYPAGAEPGLGDVHAQLKHYPNGTSGYELTVASFVSAAELLRDAPLHDPDRKSDIMDRLAIAHVQLGTGQDRASGFVWGLEEAQLQGWLDILPGEAIVSRATLTRHGMKPGDIASAVLMTRATGGTEIHVAARLDDLSRGVRDRYAFIGFDGLDDMAGLEKVGAYGRERGWIVEHDILDADHELGHAATSIVMRGNDWLRKKLGHTPPTALLRKPTPIHIAEIALGGERILEFAYDPAMLEERIAVTLAEISGDRRQTPASKSAQDFIEWQVAEYGFEISRGAGEAHLAYGREPQELALLARPDGACIAFATSSEDDLERIVKGCLDSRMPDVVKVGDDLCDVMWRIKDRPGLSIAVGSLRNRVDDLTALRAQLETSVNVSPDF